MNLPDPKASNASLTISSEPPLKLRTLNASVAWAFRLLFRTPGIPLEDHGIHQPFPMGVWDDSTSKYLIDSFIHSAF